MTSSSRLRSGMLFSAILLSSSGNVFANDFTSDNDPGGWYFYKDPIAKPEPLIPEPVLPVQKEPEKEQENDKDKHPDEEVKITSAWLRENLPKLLDEAQDNPSYENVRRYMYAQRIALDRATLFANTYRQVSQRETALNENLRRPSSPLELKALNREINDTRRELFESHYDDVGIFFFISGNSKYCESMLPILDKLNKRFKLDILPVSVDGWTFNNNTYWAAKTVFDDGTLTSAMPIDVTPTFYVINKKDMSATKMATGQIGETNFVNYLLSAMNQLNVIDNNEYQATKQVKDIYLVPTDSSNEALTVNEKALYEDSDYLADKLRESFKEKYLSPNNDHFFAPGANFNRGQEKVVVDETNGVNNGN